MHVREWQEHIRRTFHARDKRRGMPANFMWFVEEVGELSDALRSGDPGQVESEFADCFAWLATLANVAGVDLEKACDKYANGCPSCAGIPCRCVDR